MIIYYSADGSRANAELSIGDKATIMLSYFYMQNKGPDPRFQRILNEIDKPNREPFSGLSPNESLELCPNFTDVPVGVPKLHFFDSGSFSLWTEAEKFAKEHNCGEWEFYETDMFWDYLEAYASFIKEYKRGLTYYANVDVLPFRRRKPDDKTKTSFALTWRNQKELEKRGLNPIPVIHQSDPLKVLKRYLAEGYEYIALGGLVSRVKKGTWRNWMDRTFDVICDTPNRMPSTKVHGFGVTNFTGMTQYPWHSVDSTSWTKAGGFGNVLVPHKRSGKFVFDRSPYTMPVSVESPERKIRGRHLTNLNKADRTIIEEWIQSLGIPIGEWHVDEEGNVIKESNGICTEHMNRRFANLLMFEQLRDKLETKPFKSSQGDGFGFCQ